MAIPQNHPASFRDNNGYVFLEGEVVFRQINHTYQPDYEHLQQSGLLKALVKNCLLVDHKEVESHNKKAYKVIRPDPIPFITYPYEWSFSQLKEAALLTLKVQQMAFEHGMTLKDASAFNVQFIGQKPIFIDTLSFRKVQQGEPWAAYRQFCQHFLAPLAIMSYTGTPISKLMFAYLDGIPLATAVALLPWQAKLNFGLGLHLFLHHKVEQKSVSSKKQKQYKPLSRNSAVHLADSLQSTIKKLSWKSPETLWGDYYSNTNYTPAALAHKEQLVRKHLGSATGNVILDIGANNTHFSAVAAAFASHVIAIDSDAVAIEHGFLQLQQMQQDKVIPLLVDITNPTPAVGWNNTERGAFFDRVRPDTILALAIIHHLVLSNNLTLNMLATFLSSKCRYLIIEFVPSSDSQVQEMLQTRQEQLFDYTLDAFHLAFSEKFHILAQERIAQSERSIYYMQSK